MVYQSKKGAAHHGEVKADSSPLTGQFDPKNFLDTLDAIARVVPECMQVLAEHLAEKAQKDYEEKKSISYPSSPMADDKTLLDLIGQATPHPAEHFLKEVRSLSQAALDAALIQACRLSFKYLVRKLLRMGADIECQDYSGKTPLLICVEKYHPELIRFLISKKADVQAEDYAGNNVLILSVSWKGTKDMTQYFLHQAGIKINHQNKDGYTAVMKALQKMDIGKLKLLLRYYNYQHGSDWVLLLEQTVNCKGETAQQIAEKYRLGKIYTFLKDTFLKDEPHLLADVDPNDFEIVYDS